MAKVTQFLELAVTVEYVFFMPSTATNNIIFIDSRVTEYQTLIDSLTQPVEVFILDGESDGLTQMLTQLKGRSGIDSLHLISHGSQGALYLGSTVLDNASLASFRSQLAGIGDAMTPTGDILLYGCNVAQGDLGRTFIEQLAVATRADVAASINLTGSAAQGGDWLLERATGRIDSLTIASAGYQFILPSESESNDTQSTANSLALDSVVIGSMSSSSDVDYYAITVASAGILELTFDRPNNTFGGDFTVKLEDANGVALGSFVNSSDPQVFSIGIGQAGTYYARINNYLDYYYHSGQYSLSASHVAGSTAGFETESNSTRLTADTAELGEAVSGDLSAILDVDYYNIVMASAGVLQLNFTKPTNGIYATGGYRISLEDSAGTTLASFTDATGPLVAVAAVDQGGSYYARVERYSGTTSASPLTEGHYSLTVNQLAGSAAGYETEPNNSPEKADALALDTMILGQLSSRSDVDYFAITVNASGYLSLNFNRPNNFYDGQFNIGLEDANGTVLAVFKDSADPQTFTIGVSQAGTYYARVTSSFLGSFIYDGEYSLTASHVEGSISGYETESNNTRATADILTFGSAITGQLSSAADIDYYEITVGAGGVLSLVFNRPDDRSFIEGDDYVEFTLEDSTGAVFASFLNPSDPQVFNIGLAAAGTYYARVNTHIGDSLHSFIDSPYSLSGSFATGSTDGYESEGNNSRQTADLITMGGEISGQLFSTTDVDYYAITVDSEGVLNLTFDRPDRSFRDQFTISLENETGDVLTSYARLAEIQTINVGIVQAGTYYARIFNTHYYSGKSDIYSLAVNHVPGDTAGYENETNNTLLTANAITVGNSISGQLSSADDLDYYAITVGSAGIVSVDFDSPDYYGDSSFAFDFLDTSGLVLASFLDTTDPQSYSVGVSQAGTYYARVGSTHGKYASPFQDGAYSLTAAFATGSLNGGETEPNNTHATADAITMGAAILGQLSTATDKDYFAFNVAAAGVVSLNFSAPVHSADGVFTVQLEDASGQVMASFRDLSKPQVLSAALSQAGTYYARVSSSNGSILLSNDAYSLTVNYAIGSTAGFESESNNTRETANILAASMPISGQLSSVTDLDYFAISIDAPGTLNLGFNHPGYAYGGYNFINVESATGETIASFRDATNSQNFSVGIAQAGTYYARVSSYSNSMWFGNQYQISASLTADTTGLNQLRADAGDDEIYGTAGANVLDGGLGNDILLGGLGNDTYVVNSLIDLVVELVSGGSDTLQTALPTFNLESIANVENLTYLGVLAFSGTGNTAANVITGGGGNDTLDGVAGNDTLIGALGDDTYYVDVQSDVVLENAGGGIDTVVATVNLTLEWDHVENLTLTGAATLGTGNALNNTIAGNTNDNLLRGQDGDDILTGGAGDDLLHGDAGNDTLYGGDGNDTLDGGAGQNLLVGGEGNDTYMIDSLDFDINDSGGTDTAIVSTSFVKISTSIGIEHVIYTNGALALPYWIDALLPDQASGRFLTLLGPSRTIGYTYPTALPGYDTSAEDSYQFSGFNAAQKTFSKLALTYISSVLNLAFVEVNDPASVNTISFGNNAQNSSAGYAFYPSSSFVGNDVFLDKNTPGNLAPVDGQYAALTLIHELGHSLGLEHPFPGSSDAPYLTGSEDSSQWTVMSYTDDPAQYHLAYSPLDIAALQYLYGVSPTARVGNDSYTLNASSANFIWDGAGVDSMDASALSQAVTLYLEPGYWGHIGSKAATITAAGQVTVNFGTVIENLIGGAGDDFLYGSAGANSISGGFGADTLNPGSGADVVNAGAGNDTINLSADGVWTSGFAAANESLPGGAGTAQQVLLEGKNRFADVLDGGEGADTLQLTEGSDAFFLHDAYSLFNTSATLSSDARGMHSNARTTGIETLLAGAGDDIIDLTSLNYTLGGIRVEGGAGNDILWGNVGADQLLGGEGNDILFGGAGANTLTGGAGADIFQYAKGGSAHDSIGDFQMGSDKIELYGAISTDEVAVALSGDHVTVTWGAQTMDLVGITSTAGSNDWFHLA